LVIILVPICVVLLIIAVILAIKWRKSREAANKNFMELIAKVPSIKDVQVLEKIGGGAFGEVFRGLMDVRHTLLHIF
jgi:hypothetical protein